MRQTLKHPRIAHGRKHQIFVPHVADGAEQIDGIHRCVQVVRGLAHAHEHDFFDRPQCAGQHHLRHDLGTAHLPDQAFSPGHAKHTAHGTAHLRRHTHAVAGQQHAFHGLAIVQTHQQTGRTVLPRMLLAQRGQARQSMAQSRQRIAHSGGHETLQRSSPAVLRFGLRPQPEHTLFVALIGP